MSASLPAVSVVVAAYNAGRELRILFESLCASRFRDFEVCVCDDASTDDTRKVVELFSGRLAVRCAVNEANRGATYSRNRALALASAPLLLFLDADVRLRPDTIDLLLARLEREKADVVDSVYSPAALDPGLFSNYYALFVHHSFLLAGPVTRYNVFNAWCALCRADVMKAHPGNDRMQEIAEKAVVDPTAATNPLPLTLENCRQLLDNAWSGRL